MYIIEVSGEKIHTQNKSLKALNKKIHLKNAHLSCYQIQQFFKQPTFQHTKQKKGWNCFSKDGGKTGYTVTSCYCLSLSCRHSKSLSLTGFFGKKFDEKLLAGVIFY